MGRKKKVFITDFVGLCNRLEALTLGFAIHEHHGHEVCLDWPELDALQILGTRKKGIGLLDRIGSIKLRDCSYELFQDLGKYRTVIQRVFDGPESVLDRLYLPTAARIRLRPKLVDIVVETLESLSGRPVVGVHIRRGDFRLMDESIYDATRRRHSAVPLWWYEFVMGKISAKCKDTIFFLSCTGDSNEYRSLKTNFDVFQIPVPSPYGYRGKDHQATCHPVADLFSLACCRLIIATPMSTFSHCAANALGAPSTCILPPPRVEKENPLFGLVDLYGKRAPWWVKVAKEGLGLRLVRDERQIPDPMPPEWKWML